MRKLSIDLNSDVGESFGPYKLGNDEELFPYITSASIACGFHAGDPGTMRKTLELAAKNGVSVGAHPGYPDRLHFGRVALPYKTYEIVDFILYQIGALMLMAESAGLPLRHVKLHGALYHVAAEDRKLAEAFLEAIVTLHRSLIVVGPPSSVLQKEAEDRGLDYAAEGFADRAYIQGGKLMPRDRPHSVLRDPQVAANQALMLAREHAIVIDTNQKIDMKVQTLCIHGDTPGAVTIAQCVRKKLEEAKIAVMPLHQLIN